jgi:exopolysaccharide biosynthesis polyprenyl glycosylphosphotransferase
MSQVEGRIDQLVGLVSEVNPPRVGISTEFLIALAVLGDIIMAATGLSLSYWIRFKSGWIPFRTTDKGLHEFASYSPLIFVGVAFLIGTFAYQRLYEHRRLCPLRRVALTIFKGATFWLFAYLGISLTLDFNPAISRVYVAGSYICCLATLLLWRWLFNRFLQVDTVARSLRQRILFVGWNEEADRLASAVRADPNHLYDVKGYVPSPRWTLQPPSHGVPRLGEVEDLVRLLKRHQIDIMAVADLNLAMDEIIELANIAEKEFVQFKVIPSYFQTLVSGLRSETISGVPILGVADLPLDRPFNRVIKRAMDVIGAMVGLFISAPLIALFGALVYLESPGPIFYRQVRSGKNGRAFHIIKIRSMRLDAEVGGAQWTKKDDSRRLRIGKFLREWNIDEIPQFWNVLTGDMSLIGPRPERPELIANFKHQIPHYNARHASKPGITGWAQVSGFRGDTSLVERVRHDLSYMENWSLWLDIQILFLTFLKRENAY